MRIVFFFIIFIVSGFAVAQEEKSKGVSNEQIFQKISAIAEESLDKFPDKLLDIFKLSGEYVEEKKKICKGEYSDVVVGADQENETHKAELTEKEKEVCFRELKTYQIKFVEAIYDVRKLFIKKLNDQTLEDLEVAKKNAVSKIHDNFVRKFRK